MTTTAIGSIVDVALWFLDRARAADLILRPVILQRLLYIAYGAYGASNYGRKLAPAVFVVDDSGPFDPNVRRIFEFGRPVLGDLEIDATVESFIQGIWRHYGQRPGDMLDTLIWSQQVVRDARDQYAQRRDSPEELSHGEIIKAFIALARNTAVPGKRMRRGENWLIRSGGSDLPVDPTVARASVVRLPDGRTGRKWLPTDVRRRT